jgi:hypothetical protein
MLVADLAGRLEERVTELAGRVQTAAELSELVRQGAWPQASPAAFVLPLGITPRSSGDAAAGAFTQAVDESFGVLLVLRASGDLTGGRAVAPVDALTWAVISAVCGWAPAGTMGVFRLSRGAIVAASAGRVVYQIDFAIQNQVRILA